MRKRIYFIRHGQTDFNLKGIVQGSSVDAPLNATGHAQAAAFFSMHKHIPFDTVYHSALQRTKQTIQPFINLGIPTQAMAELNEIAWGGIEGKEKTGDSDQYFNDIVAQWRAGQTHIAIAGGESPNDVAERLKPVVRLLREATQENILVCLHGRCMRILLCLLLNYPLYSMDMFTHTNTGLYLVEQTGNLFRVSKANDVSHLG